MNLSEFKNHYEATTGYKAKKNSSGWLVNCNAHQDNSPSLQMSGSSDKILLKCFAGCSTEDIVYSVGLKVSDLFENQTEKKPYTVSAKYEYHNEDGSLKYWIERSNFFAKGIPVRLANDGTKIWGISSGEYHKAKHGWRKLKSGQTSNEEHRFIEETTPILYNLPQLIKEKNTPIWIFSGEPDCQLAIDLGLTRSTTRSSGEGKWLDSYNKYFENEVVCVVFDKDDTGRNDWKLIKERLTGIAKSVQVIDLELPKNLKDFSHFIESGHTIEELWDKFYGAAMPNLEAYERLCLGAILKNNNLIHSVIEREGTVNTFFSRANREILKSMLGCINDGVRISVPTLIEQLGSKLLNVGGKGYLEELEREGKVEEKIDDYLSKIRDKWEVRQVMKVADQVFFNGQTAKSAGTLKQALSAELSKVVPEKARAVSVQESAVAYAKKFGTRHPGIPTGFHDVDMATNGIPRKQLTIVAARPSMGKSSWMFNIGTNAAKLGYRGLMLSTEMDRETELAPKSLAYESFVPINNIIRDNLTPEEHIRIGSTIHLIPETFHVDDTPIVTLEQVRSKIIQYTLEHGSIDYVIVDYLQRLKGTEREKRLEITEIANGLKNYAKEFDVAMIVASSLSRESEKRIDKRPMMSDLSESSGIESASDLIFLMHREDYHLPSSESQGIVEITVAKGRNVGTHLINLAFVRDIARFENLV